MASTKKKRPWFLWLVVITIVPVSPSHGESVPNCTTQDRCEFIPPQDRTCLGATLSYSHTSAVFIKSSRNLGSIQHQLRQWEYLRNVPECWAVVQEFLCDVYMPKCETQAETATQNGNVTRPSREWCELTHSKCGIVSEITGWPEFLQCTNHHFVRSCVMHKEKLKFNVTAQCMSPLILTENKESWYSDIDRCGLQCLNPLFTEGDHQHMQTVVAVAATICMLCSIFTVLTFLIDWQNANRYPALILFFINLCYIVACLGWLLQFFPGMRQDIACRHDGTIRKAEPQIGSGESATCFIVFIMVYYFFMAAITWFVFLAFSWFLTFKVLGMQRDKVASKRAHFHLVAWSIPLVLTIVCLATTQVDGDSLSGICFVGHQNSLYRGVLLLIPIFIAIVTALFFLIKGICILVNLEKESPGLISEKAIAKIRETVIRLGVFSALALTFGIIAFSVHVYVFVNESHWEDALREYIICRISRSVLDVAPPCKLKSRPSLVAMEIHVLAFFGAGISMSSWVWNKVTFNAWKRFFQKLFRIEQDKVVQLKKHKVIAQAYNAKRGIRSGHISFSFQSSHDDPIGMKFELNSVSSHSVSTTFAQAIPRMMHRRGGLIYPSNSKSKRRHSDSDVESVRATIRRLSLESNRLSIDSYSDIEETVHKIKRKKKRKHRPKTRVTPAVSVDVQNNIPGVNQDRQSGENGAPGISLSRHGSNVTPQSSIMGHRRGSMLSIMTDGSGITIRMSTDVGDHSDSNSTGKGTKHNSWNSEILLGVGAAVGAGLGMKRNSKGVIEPLHKPNFISNQRTSYVLTASAYLPKDDHNTQVETSSCSDSEDDLSFMDSEPETVSQVISHSEKESKPALSADTKSSRPPPPHNDKGKRAHKNNNVFVTRSSRKMRTRPHRLPIAIAPVETDHPFRIHADITLESDPSSLSSASSESDDDDDSNAS